MPIIKRRLYDRKTNFQEWMRWFLDSHLGMFITWGLYSILAHGEWVMHQESIPVEEYEKLVPQFNPIRFNADEWVSIAADAGQKACRAHRPSLWIIRPLPH